MCFPEGFYLLIMRAAFSIEHLWWLSTRKRRRGKRRTREQGKFFKMKERKCKHFI